MSLTDPAAAWSIKDGPGRFAYGLNAIVDTASGIVLDVEAAPDRLGDEPKASRVTIERLRERHEFKLGVLTANKAYGSGPFLPDLRRKLNRSRDEDVRQEVLAREATSTFRASLRLHKRIERLFACIKHNDGSHRLRLRGAGEQFLLAATAHNLKRMAQALTAMPSPAVA